MGSLTPEWVNEAEAILTEVKKNGRFKRLNPVFKIADHFIRKLSKKLRAEPDQAGIYDCSVKILLCNQIPVPSPARTRTSRLLRLTKTTILPRKGSKFNE